MATFIDNFLPNFAGTVVGGVVLAWFFYLLKERLFSLPSVSGVWECEEITNVTAKKSYEGMKVKYRIILLQDGERIVGTGERHSHDASIGMHTYEGKGRVPIEVTGRINKFITKSDVISIYWIEDGTERQSSTFHKLRVSGDKHRAGLWGDFFKTAASSSGHARWVRLS